jgi:ATP-dependent exoDNAse (exonuclease V) alpha subunit
VDLAHPDLGDDQRAVLHQLLCTGNGIDIIVGAAGTGKTLLLAAAREAWQRAGYRVHGAALAALAAAQLEAGSGIAATTIHQLPDDLGSPASSGLTNNDIVVVDEAAMVGSRTLAILTRLTQQAGAKLVLTGDHRQLPEIDAGGGFRLIAEALRAAHRAKTAGKSQRGNVPPSPNYGRDRSPPPSPPTPSTEGSGRPIKPMRPTAR